VRATARITVGVTPLSGRAFPRQRRRMHTVCVAYRESRGNARSQKPRTPSPRQIRLTACVLLRYLRSWPVYRPVTNFPVAGSTRPLSHCSRTLITSVGHPSSDADAPHAQEDNIFVLKSSPPPSAFLIGPSARNRPPLMVSCIEGYKSHAVARSYSHVPNWQPP
jgi:hypothetical protein